MQKIGFGRKAVLALAVAAGIAACDDRNFSQLDGFESLREVRAATPPPNAEEIELLRLHRPRLFLTRGAPPPLDFYRDYIAHGRLRDGAGRLVSEKVDAATLNQYRGDPGAVFAHRPPPSPEDRPRGYGGVLRATLSLGGAPLAMTVLTYHFAFRHSGLPQKMAQWKKTALFFGLRDWHQLDHYTAAFVALDARRNPAAVMLQHHNHLRAWLVGEDAAFAPGRRIRIDVATGSNELYPHREGGASWRTANFMTAETFPWLAGLADSPPNFYCCAEDETRGEVELDYELAILPPDDAFYVFEGKLGERRSLPGRDGPPGAIYNTWPPQLTRVEKMLPFFYWREGDIEYAEILRLDSEAMIEAMLRRAAAKKLLTRLRG